MKLEPTPIGTPMPQPDRDSVETELAAPKTHAFPTWLIPLGIGVFGGFMVFGVIGLLLFVARENVWKERMQQRDSQPTNEKSIRQK